MSASGDDDSLYTTLFVIRLESKNTVIIAELSELVMLVIFQFSSSTVEVVNLNEDPSLDVTLLKFVSLMLRVEI